MQCELKLELIPRVHGVSIQLKLHVTTGSLGYKIFGVIGGGRWYYIYETRPIEGRVQGN